MHMCTCMCIHVHVNVYVYVYVTHVHACLGVCTCACVCVFVCAYVRVKSTRAAISRLTSLLRPALKYEQVKSCLGGNYHVKC